MTGRRDFFKVPAATLHTAGTAPTSGKAVFYQPDSSSGHRLRTGDFPDPVEQLRADVVITGGGVAGLTAARALVKSGFDVLLLELESEPGGTSSSATVRGRRAPWGAHYLTVPDPDQTDLLHFLEEAGAVTSLSGGSPVFNPYMICHAPQERLFLNGFWQDGLIPTDGLRPVEKEEFRRFFALIEQFREARGRDGRRAFAIPASRSSTDARFRELDSIRASEFLARHNFKSAFLLWYLDYCCLDDFGAATPHVSAWALIHYFAARNGDTGRQEVLTWPEGNFFLIQALLASIQPAVRTRHTVYRMRSLASGVETLAWDAARNVSIRINSRYGILAVPDFVAARILGDTGFRPAYSAWLVAQLVVEPQFSELFAREPAWDNVVFGRPSLGYINHGHQELQQPSGERILTFYEAFGGRESLDKSVFARLPASFWERHIYHELRLPHPDLERHTLEMQLRFWAHGMTTPEPGFLNRRYSPVSSGIFRAHTDQSGIALFEEAFARGLEAARSVQEAAS